MFLEHFESNIYIQTNYIAKESKIFNTIHSLYIMVIYKKKNSVN